MAPNELRGKLQPRGDVMDSKPDRLSLASRPLLRWFLPASMKARGNFYSPLEAAFPL